MAEILVPGNVLNAPAYWYLRFKHKCPSCGCIYKLTVASEGNPLEREEGMPAQVQSTCPQPGCGAIVTTDRDTAERL